MCVHAYRVLLALTGVLFIALVCCFALILLSNSRMETRALAPLDLHIK